MSGASVVGIVIGQDWQHKRTGTVVRVRQIHRKDKQVLVLVMKNGAKQYVSFSTLREHYVERTLYI